jgi:hypothetical protein
LRPSAQRWIVIGSNDWSGSTAEEYASRVIHVLNHHCGHEASSLLAVAWKLATPA